MSSENSDPQRLKFSLAFMKIDAEGKTAIHTISKPLLILASAVAVSVLIIAANGAHVDTLAWIIGKLRFVLPNW